MALFVLARARRGGMGARRSRSAALALVPLFCGALLFSRGASLSAADPGASAAPPAGYVVADGRDGVFRGKRVWRHAARRATLVRDEDHGRRLPALSLQAFAEALKGAASHDSISVAEPTSKAGDDASSAVARRLLAARGKGPPLSGGLEAPLGNHAVPSPLPALEWRMIPEYVGAVRPGAPALTWNVSSYREPCYAWTSASASPVERPDAAANGTFATTVVFTTPAPREGGLLGGCSDWYALLTTTSWHVERLAGGAGEHTVRWEGLSADEAAEIAEDGVRVFHFQEDVLHTLAATFETAALFTSELTQGVDAGTAARNAEFLRDYAGVDMRKREDRSARIPDEEDVQSGDLFCIVRLDGLDPLIMWGSGSFCGHNVVALRINSTLYITESQTKSSYWPTNFVQRTPYAQWMKQAQEASYNVLHLRLSPTHARLFAEREKQVAEIFATEHEGRLYGYVNMLFTWMDVGNDNLPTPADWRLVACGFALLDPLLDRLIAKADPPVPSLWNSALSQRLGLALPNDKETAELLAIARARNMSFLDLLKMPEQDDWIYPGAASGEYPSGPASVCDVFVCRLWKAAGFFDGVEDVQCTEFAPIDLSELAFYEGGCAEADPSAQRSCQIMGDYSMVLRHFNEVTPFAHMRQRCPSKPPHYPRRFSAEVQSTC